MRSIWRDSRFLEVLLAIDRGLAEQVQVEGCPHCGGILDVSNYPRKTRGVDDKGAAVVRLSFSCREDGCRKRATPESVRFLGRKVYSGVVVILAVFEPALSQALNLCRQTLSRWRSYWADVFSFGSPFWKSRVALFPPGFDAKASPEAVVQFFEGQAQTAEETARTILRFFSPLSRSFLHG